MRRALAILAATIGLGLAGCPGERAPAPAPAPVEPPRLVVLVVVDQLPAWAFPARAAAAEDGVARALASGRRWTGRFPYAATSTAPGHATLSTGAPPAVTGILGNEWYRRELGEEVEAAELADGTPSAAWLEVDGLADALARARPGSRAVAVALKGRSAILGLGKTGRAVWYEADCACFVTIGEPPAWVTSLAAAHPIAPRLHEPWTPLDPARLGELSGVPDDAPGELAIPGWTATFPHDLQTARNPARALVDAPLGNQVVVEAALAAIAGEQLGADADADLLVVSFSAHDYIGHAFGLDSWEAWDAWLRLDRQLGDLWRALDAEVGAGRWAAVVTSDHGSAELPERRAARGDAGARITYEQVAEVADAAADRVAGEGDWIAAARYPTIYLSAAARALPDDVRGRVVDAIVAAVAAMPGIERADRAADLTGGCAARAGDDRAICETLHPTRSGEVFYAPAEGTVLHKASWLDATGHGSLHAYDSHVPVIVVAPGVAPARIADPVSMLRVAPTVADLLDVPPPSAATEPSLLAD